MKLDEEFWFDVTFAVGLLSSRVAERQEHQDERTEHDDARHKHDEHGYERHEQSTN